MHHSNVELFNVEAEGNITSPPWGNTPICGFN